jgi:transcription elongation factor Elf1
MALPEVTNITGATVTVVCDICGFSLGVRENVSYTFMGHSHQGGVTLDAVKYAEPFKCPNCNGLITAGGFLCDHALQRHKMEAGEWIPDWGTLGSPIGG